MRAPVVIALHLIGCTGDILPISLPGPLFYTEVGNTPGAMHQVRGGVAGPIAAGGGADPILLERRNGGWIPLPTPAGWSGPIRDVAAVDGALIVAGDGGQIALGEGGRFDPIQSNTAAELRSVFARGAGDAFFAGSGGLFHYDGSAVSEVETASIAEAERFFAVWGTATAVVVTGAGGLALMIDGDDARLTDTGTIATLRAVHGRSSTEIFAVGGDDKGAVLRWDGRRWNDIALSVMPRLHAVFAGRTDLWVVGDAGYLAQWDGFIWTEILTGSLSALNGAFEQEGDLFVTGGNVLDPTSLGFVARFGD